MNPAMHDTAERTLSRLAMFDDRFLWVEGKQLTKNVGRSPIIVHDSMFRRFTCVDGCSVCCTMTHTLDWLPSEWERSFAHLPSGIDLRATAYSRQIALNRIGEPVYVETVYTIEKVGPCEFLQPNRPSGGLGCAFWPDSPIECWAAVNMRVVEMPTHISITKQPMARAWRYNPAPACLFSEAPLSEMDLETNLSIFMRYLEWAQYFKLDVAEARLGSIIQTFERILAGTVEPKSFTVS